MITSLFSLFFFFLSKSILEDSESGMGRDRKRVCACSFASWSSVFHSVIKTCCAKKEGGKRLFFATCYSINLNTFPSISLEISLGRKQNIPLLLKRLK